MTPLWKQQREAEPIMDPSNLGPYELDADHAQGLLEEFDRIYWQGSTWAFYRAWRPVLAELVDSYTNRIPPQ